MVRRAVTLVLAVSALAACSESRITAPPQAADESPPSRVAPALGPPPVGTFTQVSGGWFFGCVLRTDGQLACWGENGSGQGNAPAGSFIQVNAGKEHACAVRTDASLACWGFNFNGESAPPPGTFTQVAAGSYFSCALRTDSTIACWGLNNLGQASPPAGTFTQLSSGSNHSCALEPGGSLTCWGQNNFGQANAPAGTYTQVSAGSAGAHSCAVATSGSVVCWGNNSDGQASPPPGTFSSVTAGMNHTCALRPDGIALCWGRNDFGQAAPPPVSFAALDAGDVHTCGITPTQDLVCWGALVAAPPNHPPVAITGGPYTTTEGAPLMLGLNGTDPDNDLLDFSWDLGDGTTGYRRPPTSHTYADDGVYTIRLTVSDRRGGVDTKTTTVTVANVAPSIPAGGLSAPAAPTRLVAGIASVLIELTFADPAGSRDSYSAEIRCGNGTMVMPTTIPSPYVTSCLYTAPGTYTVTATVSDEDGGTSEPAQTTVVIQPAVELSATGGGWFAFRTGSAAQALKHQFGKAHFTFDAALGASGKPPEGSAKFWLQEGGPNWAAYRPTLAVPPTTLDFQSTSITMLTVTGRRAVVWGYGTLNGAAGYMFRITAVDGEGGAADAFRIQIWRAGGVLVYDNQWGAPPDAELTTPIGGGEISVRVHEV